MSSTAVSPTAPHFNEATLKRGAGSVRHPLERALLALTFTTGLVDAVSYLALGRVFTANMTGNVVLLGFGMAGSAELPVVAPIVSLGAFLIGAGAGGVLMRRMAGRHPALVARGQAIETSLLAIAAVVAATTTLHSGNAPAYALIVLMASAMGVRNAVVRSIALPDLTTTVLTMTLTGVIAVDASVRRRRQQRQIPDVVWRVRAPYSGLRGLRYYLASLAELGGGGVAVLAVVGLTDEGMPPAIGQSYLHQANPNGVDFRPGEIPAAGHFHVVDPARPSWADVRLWIAGRVCGPQHGPGRTELPAELHEGQR